VKLVNAGASIVWFVSNAKLTKHMHLSLAGMCGAATRIATPSTDKRLCDSVIKCTKIFQNAA